MTKPTNTNNKWFRFLSMYGVTLVACAVAINQLLLRSEGISSWKGGGFGMYADFHPVYTKIFLKSTANNTPNSGYIPSEKAIKLMRSIQLFPNEHYVDQLKTEYNESGGEGNLLIQVWNPVYDPENGSFGLILRKEY